MPGGTQEHARPGPWSQHQAGTAFGPRASRHPPALPPGDAAPVERCRPGVGERSGPAQNIPSPNRSLERNAGSIYCPLQRGRQPRCVRLFQRICALAATRRPPFRHHCPDHVETPQEKPMAASSVAGMTRTSSECPCDRGLASPPSHWNFTAHWRRRLSWSAGVRSPDTPLRVMIYSIIFARCRRKRGAEVSCGEPRNKSGRHSARTYSAAFGNDVGVDQEHQSRSTRRATGFALGGTKSKSGSSCGESASHSELPRPVRRSYPCIGITTSDALLRSAMNTGPDWAERLIPPG